MPGKHPTIVLAGIGATCGITVLWALSPAKEPDAEIPFAHVIIAVISRF